MTLCPDAQLRLGVEKAAAHAGAGRNSNEVGCFAFGIERGDGGAHPFLGVNCVRCSNVRAALYGGIEFPRVT